METVSYFNVSGHDYELVDKQARNDIELKANKTELQSVASGSPAGVYVNLSALQSAEGVDKTRIYLTIDNNNWNYWNGSSWISGGVYLGTKEKLINLTWNSGHYIGLDGSIQELEHFQYCNEYIPVDFIKSINTTLLYSASCIALYDKNKTFIKGFDGKNGTVVTNISDYVSAVREDVAYVRFSYNSNSYTFNIEFKSLIDVTNEIKSITGDIKLTWASGYFINLNGEIKNTVYDGDTPATNWRYCKEYIPIEFIKSIKTSLLYDASCIALYDKDKTFIKGFDGKNGTVVNSIDAYTGFYPNAVYVRFSYNKTYDFNIEFKTMSDIINYHGSNLKIEDGAFIRYDNGQIEQNASFAYVMNYIPLENISNIKIPLYYYGACIAFYDRNFNYLGGIQEENPDDNGKNYVTDLSTTPENTVYVRFSINKNNLINTNITINKTHLLNNLITNYYDIKTAPYKGKVFCFIGDSITAGAKSKVKYWEYISSLTGATCYGYGVSGATLKDMLSQAQKIKSEHPEADAIFILGGTNDYNASVNLGKFYTEETVSINSKQLKHRVTVTDNGTVCGRLNNLLSYLKHNYAEKQIFLLTPLHRGEFGSGSTIQKDESYANSLGLYISDYVEKVKEAGSVWSVPVIDLYKNSGLYPSYDASASLYFNVDSSDRLHPNAEGHKRMAHIITKELQHIYYQ